jgi:ABC-type multidrug transport system fused ATPase/permease subunit
MDLIETLIKEYLSQERWYIIIILFLSLAINLFQVNGISIITAKIIESIQKNQVGVAKQNYGYFVIVSIMFLLIYHVYKHYQNLLFTKLPNWIRRELVKFIVAANNENMSSINFSKLIPPINRITGSIYGLMYRLMVHMFPDIVFVLVICSYFLFKSLPFGFFFLFSNIFIIMYMFIGWSDVVELRKVYEQESNDNEKYLIDIFNNMEKIIFRGKGQDEIDNYYSITESSTKRAVDFYKKVDEKVLTLNVIMHAVIFILIGGLFYLYLRKKINIETFVAFFTIILLYRDRMSSNYESLVDYIEFFGKLNYIGDILSEFTRGEEEKNKIYDSVDLPFDTIRFENVSYKYPGTNTMIYDNFNIEFNTQNKIIGLTGISGKGKSTFVKLIVKLYRPTGGAIYIDDKNIDTIDPNYIRKNITYVNQTSKLFDSKIIDNILYGCSDQDVCNGHLEEILKYPKIVELYKNLDIRNDSVGSFGDKLSGGQRQVTNIIGGLVNPCKILILDEPTNALDIELKKELIGLIRDFKKHKKCIIIITHDEDVYPLFTEKLNI